MVSFVETQPPSAAQSATIPRLRMTRAPQTRQGIQSQPQGVGKGEYPRVLTVEIRCFGAALALVMPPPARVAACYICLARARLGAAREVRQSQMSKPVIFTISAIWDDEASVWSGHCDDIPAAADAPRSTNCWRRYRRWRSTCCPTIIPTSIRRRCSCRSPRCAKPSRPPPKMAPQFDKPLRDLLRAAGCMLVRQGKGSHEIWHSPITKCRWAFRAATPPTHSASGDCRSPPEQPPRSAHLVQTQETWMAGTSPAMTESG